ncbi:MAG: hypothetical protein N3B10_08040 [Armatimonadetes bacterium]|nr:hypothetical protein [Armatimonadota bacterium]
MFLPPYPLSVEATVAHPSLAKSVGEIFAPGLAKYQVAALSFGSPFAEVLLVAPHGTQVLT